MSCVEVNRLLPNTYNYFWYCESVNSWTSWNWMNKRSTGIPLLIFIGYNVICFFITIISCRSLKDWQTFLGTIHGGNAVVHGNIVVKKEHWMTGASRSRKKMANLLQKSFVIHQNFTHLWVWNGSSLGSVLWARNVSTRMLVMLTSLVDTEATSEKSAMVRWSPAAQAWSSRYLSSIW